MMWWYRYAFAFTALVLLLVPGPAHSQPTGGWAFLDSSGPARSAMGFTYDGGRDRVVLACGVPRSGEWPSETWEWDGDGWSRVGTSGPEGRGAMVTVYDEARGKVLLFGGWTPPDDVLGDNWSWDGTFWTLLSPASSPPPTCAMAFAYDRHRQRVVMFGGARWQTIYGTTWEWDGTTWAQRSNSGPSARFGCSMAYDARNRRCVLFGGTTHYNGTVMHDTWLWDGTTWVLADTIGPASRISHAMAYDTVRGRVLLFGGQDQYYRTQFYHDTWEWDGSRWESLPSDGPAERYSPGMTFHGRLGRILLFGGANDLAAPPMIHRDLWMYPGLEHDAAADKIMSPTGIIQQGSVIVPLAVVSNRGLNPEAYPILLRIGDTYSSTRSVAQSVGEADTVAFDAWHAETPGTFVVKCSTMLVGDECPTNDCKIETVTVRPVAVGETKPRLALPTTPSLEVGSPFSVQTTVRYALPQSSRINLAVFNSTGALVRVLASGFESAGFRRETWDGRDEHDREVPSGLYLCRLQAGEFRATGKVIKSN